MRKRSDVVIFAEDPGALAFVEPLVKFLRAGGYSVILAAAGIAAKVLSEKNFPFVLLEGETNAQELLTEARPKLIVVGTAENPRTAGLALIDAGRSQKITTVGVVDAPMNAEKRFSGIHLDPLAHKPDFIVVPDETTRAEFLKLGFSSGSVMALGHPQLDVVLGKLAAFDVRGKQAMRKELFPKVGEKEKIIIFLDEGPRRLDILSAEYLNSCTLHGTSESPGRTEIVLEEFLLSFRKLKEGNPHYYLVLRLHPKSVPDDYNRFRSSVNEIHSGGSALEVIYCSDLVVSSTTILLLESALLARKTLSIVPKQEEGNWLMSVRNGATPCAWKRADIPIRLNEALFDEGRTDQIRALQSNFLNSTNRITEFLGKFLD